MRSKLSKKLKPIGLAAVMAVSLLSANMTTAFAGDTWPFTGAAAIGKNQPRMIGQRVYDLENWNPETEPYADLMRAQIPLQQRNSTFSATQANPNLKSDAEILNMQGDYGNSFFEGTPYNNEFSQYLFNYWQYTDYYASWHGVATKGAPSSVYEPDGAWQKRYFEFGLINMPNPAYTNAAHKNGVKSIGCIFLPRAGQTHASMIKKDEQGEFPIAKKLIEFANYYGFDGYFINQEESIPAGDVPIYKQFTKYLIEHGMYIQWYDSITPTGSLNYQNQLNASNSTFIQDDKYGLGKVNSSLFVNYDWFRSNRIETSLAHAKNRGINPYTEVFFGVEANQNKLSGSHGSGKEIEKLYQPGTKNLRASVALFTPSDFIQNGLDEDLTGSNAPNKRADDKYQWMIAERERMYYSGVAQDPTRTGKMQGYQNPKIGIKDAGGWVGVADFASERSVVNGTNFVTNFNTGHGLEYVMNGQVSNPEEWSNMNLQDILPTWQWWINVPQKAAPTPQNPNAKADAGSKLKVDFDYGEKYDTGAYTYQRVGAYNGGSSLVVAGKLDVENFLRLYKTDIDVVNTSKIDITFNKKSQTDGSEMKVGLIFKDAPDKVVYIPVPDSGTNTKGWVTRQLKLEGFAGKKIAAMGVAFNPKQGKVADYQMNIGEIKLTDGAAVTPKTPTGFKIDRTYDTTEMKLSWDIADYKEVKQYNIYANLSNGKRVFLGGTYGNTYYIKSLYGEKGMVSLELTAVGADKSESKPAAVDYDFSTKVRGIKVAEAKTPSGNFTESANAGFLDVNWTNPEKNVLKINLAVTLNNSASKQIYTKTVESNITSTKIEVPTSDGSEYTLAISTVNEDGSKNPPINYIGKLKDVYVAPFTEGVKFNGSSVTFEIPRAEDWWHMYATFNGTPLTFRSEYDTSKQFAIRGKSFIHDVPLPSTEGVLTIIMEDYAGNKSVPVNIPYGQNGSKQVIQ